MNRPDIKNYLEKGMEEFVKDMNLYVDYVESKNNRATCESCQELVLEETMKDGGGVSLCNECFKESNDEWNKGEDHLLKVDQNHLSQKILIYSNMTSIDINEDDLAEFLTNPLKDEYIMDENEYEDE